ncbi:transcriptional regulator [Paramagnetospirillum kuznetsovii]|uniref:Transcriptional regulator n=2 Tax=Paramagnetospirillum kuznetsovii TaxID=2053833 RepID=A0A364NZH3_9PROT|nr:helix-turn-helix transcriptional regulator [Paramagnetospirillum kuznetsovii]RAU22474.1 transcriptional regulator [Paramagnetospirillum kuznetsovii]
MARAALFLGFRELAKMANVSPNTIARLERGESMNPRTLVKVRTVLEDAGVMFIDADEVGGVGVRVKGERNAAL